MVKAEGKRKTHKVCKKACTFYEIRRGNLPRGIKLKQGK